MIDSMATRQAVGSLPLGVAAVKCGRPGLQQLLTFALAFRDGAAGALDVRAGARVAAIQEQDARPDADCELVLSAETFPAPRPARTTVCAEFVLPGMLIEVEVTAGVPS